MKEKLCGLMSGGIKAFSGITEKRLGDAWRNSTLNKFIFKSVRCFWHLQHLGNLRVRYQAVHKLSWWWWWWGGGMQFDSSPAAVEVKPLRMPVHAQRDKQESPAEINRHSRRSMS